MIVLVESLEEGVVRAKKIGGKATGSAESERERCEKSEKSILVEKRLWTRALKVGGEAGRKEGAVWVESKHFVIRLKEIRGWRKGFIEERCKGFYSWVRLGFVGFDFLLEGLDLGCSGVPEKNWTQSWKEEGRCYSLELCKSKARSFFGLGLWDVKGNFFSIIFLKGERRGEGWAALAEKLRYLGVTSREEKEGKELGKVQVGAYPMKSDVEVSKLVSIKGLSW